MSPSHRDDIDLPVDRPVDDATSAADADWLAELRATARQRNTTLADVVTDIDTNTDRDTDTDTDTDTDANGSDDHDHDHVVGTPDDEVTTGSPAALDDIRRLARQERQARERAAADTEATIEIDAPVPVVARSTPEVPPEIRPAAPRLTAADHAGAVPRWEAPPRLEAAATAETPGVLGRSKTPSGPDWRITALAVAVALLVGVVITLLFLRGGSTEPVEQDPDGTTLVDGSPVPAAPPDQQENE